MKRRERSFSRSRTAPLFTKGSLDPKISYKNYPLLQKFITDRGKIVSRRISGVSAKEQRRVSFAIKQARYLGLLPSGGVKK